MHRAGLPLRPASRLTSAEAGADRETINLRCSVLGAHGNLVGGKGAVKHASTKFVANCAFRYFRRNSQQNFRDHEEMHRVGFALVRLLD